MTTFHFNGQHLDNDLVTSISSLLDAFNIPNLLWGNYLLTVYGVPTVVDPPYKHLHIDDEFAILLYKKSDVLWEFPEFEAAFHDTSADIMFASDARLPPATLGRGRGHFPHLSSVRIPSPSRYCEALILLLCRDYGTTRETYWVAILTYMLEFVDGTDILNEGGLTEGHKQFYHALKLGDPTMYPILKDLHRDFLKRRLPQVKQN
ncbi:hypothetical protein BDV37DRAFT_269773 [Aspergillus pseudonomiae]|uniref:Uncharacterized protein n=1 Tax=Aspergillus pseudonomiae TaxID=1506151 RepID=A0A5N7DJX8_9EURO|nr:uncharacterized protein BDV37DRAFT_269773 [Aspergillus pseudonomiae]KAE8406746.1 hypothetical protein BDV37DRAFT_269773 [Aspergillus pseudonomiae]